MIFERCKTTEYFNQAEMGIFGFTKKMELQ